jgi:hypothetical protein
LKESEAVVLGKMVMFLFRSCGMPLNALGLLPQLAVDSNYEVRK